MHPTIDLRSDTVTRPTPEMRRAMAEAVVGDDVYDDDPTVHRLQERSAALLGKEAGLFMASGTMGNAVAIKTHTRPGDEILLDGDAHSMLYEVGLPATIAQVLTRQFPSTRGVPSVDGIRERIHAESLHNPGTALIVLENTHNRAGGTIIPLEVHRAIREIALERGILVHLDGARLFHAAVATGQAVAEYAAYTDTVTFCLSKGLGCPIGSVLCGTRDFIERARRVRKMLGGGMRQVGILAAGLANAPGIIRDAEEPSTNMVYFNTVAPAQAFVEALASYHNVLCNAMGSHRIRLVTHLDVDAEDMDRAAAAVCKVGQRPA